MRFSRTLIPTLKEAPAEAHIVSHRLMLRAGMIRQVSAGIYTWLPLGLRVLRKVEAIVRREMDAAGAQEVLMPAVQPAELWMESGRWSFYGKELLRLSDRHEREFCIGPTHEEVITDLVRREIHSYKHLPANFYQIQTKFRDEIRPRFGIMRGREFLMKDAYSFDADEASAQESYRVMCETYGRIFTTMGLNFRPVEADSGNIGGAFSHEFHVLAASGEDVIVSCDGCDYAANLEKASSAVVTAAQGEGEGTMERVATPGRHTIDEVAQLLNESAENLIKSLVVESDRGPFLLLLRGDRELNEVKAKNALAVQWVTLAEGGRVKELTGVGVGSIGPVASNLPILADQSLKGRADLVCGANEEGYHFTGVCPGRDFPEPLFADLCNVVAGDPCPRCTGGRLTLDRGIEVGHVFKLGVKYSQAMGVTVQDETGGERTPIMGCYGIGVSRLVAAAIEQNHDDNGIIWPQSIAPFAVEVVLLNPNDAQAAPVADALYRELAAAGIEVLLDDRDERPGVKFKDADLLGIPLTLVVGGRGLKKGVVEVKRRDGSGQWEVSPDAVVSFLQELLRN